MPRSTNWRCDGCGLQAEGDFKTPRGWVETSFWTGIKFVRNSFCSYSCLAEWAGKRYDVPKYGEGVNNDKTRETDDTKGLYA